MNIDGQFGWRLFDVVSRQDCASKAIKLVTSGASHVMLNKGAEQEGRTSDQDGPCFGNRAWVDRRDRIQLIARVCLWA
jgi:hypothetical protein